ncbi:helix-turn-helix domain-containing protein [Priestia megaterium]|uniref:helix-turn-helix domain-containing protein n=1 Tax=Priestia megaterium TaxID=1404 RepID=UPI0039F6E818
MISYEPLFKTLKEKNVNLTEFWSLMSSATAAKFKKDEHVSTKTIEKVCLFLDVPVEKVIKFVKE